MAFTTPPGWIVLPLALATLIIATAKTWRVRSICWYIPLALAQAGAILVLIYTLIGPVFPTAGVPGDILLVVVLAGVAAAAVTLVDLLISLRFIWTAASADRSLNVRTTILLSIMPAALALAGMFRLGWDWELLETTVSQDGNSYALHTLFSLGGIILACVFAVTGLLVAIAPTPGGGVRGDRCARVWFSLMFLCAPLSAILTGLAALLAPKDISGGFVLLHSTLAPAVVALGNALMKEMLNNGMYADPVGGGDKMPVYV